MPRTKQKKALPPSKLNGRICPDGKYIYVNWEALTVGASVFIPAVNMNELKKQIRAIALARNIKIRGVERIESGKLGMRFWRIR